MIRVAEIVGAYVLDLLVGDPPHIPHPVVGMGRVITWLERNLYPQAERRSAQAELLRGALLLLALLSLVYFLSRGVLYLAGAIHPYLERALSLWLLSTALAARGLGRAARDVYRPLVQGDLPGARSALAQVVGRDTAGLPEEEIIRGAVETTAENIVDGVTAPLFYAVIGGVPLALLYKAVNTLDSMLGYKNERYFYFGRAAARVDDLFNYIPARLTFFLLLAAGMIVGKKREGSWLFLWHEARRHPSPNSGLCEAAVAGILGVRLGGMNYYQGRPSFRAYMGKPSVPLDSGHILETVKIMYVVELLFLLFMICSYFAVMGW